MREEQRKKFLVYGIDFDFLVAETPFGSQCVCEQAQII